MKVVRLSTLHTSHLYTPGNILGVRLLEAESTPDRKEYFNEKLQ
jgi:hypothetical protein